MERKQTAGRAALEGHGQRLRWLRSAAAQGRCRATSQGRGSSAGDGRAEVTLSLKGTIKKIQNRRREINIWFQVLP